MDFDKNICPVLNVDGVMATGKQFDLEINLPEDNRTVRRRKKTCFSYFYR